MKPTFVNDYQAIEAVLNAYGRGGKEAKSDIMAPSFHEQATIYGLDGDGKFNGGLVKDELFPVIDGHFKPSNPTAVIAYIDINGTAASARVDTNDISGFCFTDYFNLLKIDGKWQIVNKIYHTNHAE